jgi:hypothetical protein
VTHGVKRIYIYIFMIYIYDDDIHVFFIYVFASYAQIVSSSLVDEVEFFSRLLLDYTTGSLLASKLAFSVSLPPVLCRWSYIVNFLSLLKRTSPCFPLLGQLLSAMLPPPQSSSLASIAETHWRAHVASIEESFDPVTPLVIHIRCEWQTSIMGSSPDSYF